MISIQSIINCFMIYLLVTPFFLHDYNENEQMQVLPISIQNELCFFGKRVARNISFMILVYFLCLYKTKHNYYSLAHLTNNIAIKSYYFTTTTLCEYLSYRHIYLAFTFYKGNKTYNCICFVPIAFLTEIIFDFFHYWTHRISHENTTLYRMSHKIHHQYSMQQIGIFDTFTHSPLDYIITNTMPFTIAMYAMSDYMTLLQFTMIGVFKTYVEIFGHTGIESRPCSSFPEFMWIPKYLGIELYSEDHENHHKYVTCNYSKRFLLFDQLFNTYKISKNTE